MYVIEINDVIKKIRSFSKISSSRRLFTEFLMLWSEPRKSTEPLRSTITHTKHIVIASLAPTHSITTNTIIRTKILRRFYTYRDIVRAMNLFKISLELTSKTPFSRKARLDHVHVQPREYVKNFHEIYVDGWALVFFAKK